MFVAQGSTPLAARLVTLSDRVRAWDNKQYPLAMMRVNLTHVVILNILDPTVAGNPIVGGLFRYGEVAFRAGLPYKVGHQNDDRL